MSLGLCAICHQLPARGRFGMCETCGVSYDRVAHRDGSVIEAMVWAAKRARHFERKRQVAKRLAVGPLQRIRKIAKDAVYTGGALEAIGDILRLLGEP